MEDTVQRSAEEALLRDFFAAASRRAPSPCAERLLATARTQRFEENQVIWHEGMDTAPACVLLDGVLRYQSYRADGQRRILNILVPGEIAGPETFGRPGYTLEAATPGVLARFRAADFAAALRECRDLRRTIYLGSVAKIDRLRWLTWTILALPPRERLCAFLASATRYLPLATDAGGRMTMTLSISRRDIADLIATTPETLCRTFKALDTAGLIHMRDTTTVEIPSLDVLRAACGSDSVPANALAGTPPMAVAPSN